MKPWQKILYSFIGGSLLFIIISLVIPIATKSSWWWFGITFSLIIFLWILAGTVFLISKAFKQKTKTEKINIRAARARAVYEMKYDENNPDNFKINNENVIRVGEAGSERTPVLLLEGKGTECNQRRVIVVNLNNPKQEQTKLIDPTDQDIILAAKLIAEHPQDEIMEKTEMSRDQFGNPTMIKTVKKASISEQKEAKDKEEAEEKNAM